MEKLIQQSMLDSFIIKVYGESISEYENSDITLSNELGEKSLTVVKVKGIQINGMCKKIDSSLTLVLPGNGIEPDGCGFKGSDTIKMWMAKKDTIASKINIISGKLEELVSEESILGIGISIKFENVRNENGKIKGTIRFKIDIGVASINHAENFTIDSNIGNWQKIWSGSAAGVLEGALYVKASSLTKICAKVEVRAKLPDICHDDLGIPYPCLKWKSDHKVVCAKV